MDANKFVLQINSNSELYDQFITFLGEKEEQQNFFLDEVLIKNKGTLCTMDRYETMIIDGEKAFNKQKIEVDKVGFKFGYSGLDYQEFMTNDGDKYYVQHYEEGDAMTSNGATMKHIVFTLSASSKLILQKVICEVQNFQTTKEKDKIRIYIKGPRNSWKLNAELPKREVSSVYLKNRDEIMEDIDTFLNSEEEYVKYGMPYKRNYLFYGKPGTGKTSFITSIASKYDLDIYLLTFDADLDDRSFKNLVSFIPNNGILVIEDIHNVHFSETGKNMKAIGLSSVLNTLDGLARKNRLLSFMTTNFYDKLEQVLTRPGRIDKIVEFTLVNEDIFDEMLSAFFPSFKEEKNKSYDKLWGVIRSSDISPAILQKYLFENRKSDNIASKELLQTLHNLIEQYTPKDQYDAHRLYM